jgi:Ni,Fe-hydrogenase III small subunit/ferredoxin
MPWIARGLRHGVVTTGWPARDDVYERSWRGGVGAMPDVLPNAERAAVEALCPTAAISVDDDGLRLDRGRCILCGHCVRDRPDLFAWSPGAATAAASRTTLVVPAQPETDEAIASTRDDLAARTKILRRSVHIRHVDAGSDGSEEWEILALLNPVYDVHRLGVFFTASPRHADILLVSGVGATGMLAPLARTLEAMPTPTVVVAAGTDAISGGLVHPTYATSGGIGGVLPVDVWVPGSPPSPFSLLHGLLLAVGRLT